MSIQQPTYPKPTAQVEPYVKALGVENTLVFLEAFGGTEVYIAADPKPHSKLVRVLGRSKAKALAEIRERLQARVPLAKNWRARCYYVQGLKTSQIARKLGVSDTTVREYLKGVPKNLDPNQLNFPFD